MSDSSLVLLAKTVERFPLYIYEFVIQTLIAMMSDFTVTTLLLGSLALWLATNLWWAIATFFLLFTIARTVNSIANAIGVTGQHLAQMSRPAMMPQVVHTPGRTMVVSGDGEAHS